MLRLIHFRTPPRHESNNMPHNTILEQAGTWLQDKSRHYHTYSSVDLRRVPGYPDSGHAAAAVEAANGKHRYEMDHPGNTIIAGIRSHRSLVRYVKPGRTGR